MKDDDDIQEYVSDKNVNDIRNQVLEEVAHEFDCMRIAFGDTAASFAQYVREMKYAKTKAPWATTRKTSPNVGQAVGDSEPSWRSWMGKKFTR